MVDACQRASAHTVNVVLPYFGYARQDRTAAPREPITAKLVANMLVKAGVDRVVTLDLHACLLYTSSFFVFRKSRPNLLLGFGKRII